MIVLSIQPGYLHENWKKLCTSNNQCSFERIKWDSERREWEIYSVKIIDINIFVLKFSHLAKRKFGVMPVV